MLNGLRPLDIFIGGFILAVLLQGWVMYEYGGPAAIIQVGDDSEVARFIEAELGPVPRFPALGHDGQAFYVIARQPFGGPVILELDAPAYRFGRWLYPALAGGLGLFGPRTTMFGLAFWSAFGFGLSAAGTVMIGVTYGIRSRLVALGAFLNPGLMLAAVMSVADSLGLGLSLMAVAACRKEKLGVCVGLLTLAVLTKEQFIIFAIAIALNALLSGRWGRALWLIGVPLIAILAFTGFLTVVFGGTGGVGHIVGPPLSGIVEAASGWAGQSSGLRRAAYLVLVGLPVLLAVALWSKDRLILLMSAGWVAGGLLLGEVVWRKGTDAIRVLAAVWPLLALAVAVGVVRRSRVEQPQTLPRQLSA